MPAYIAIKQNWIGKRGNEQMKKGSYLANAAILTGAGLLLRAAGMVFRVLIAGKIGAEGMGLYQLIFTVYQLFITASTAGISMAASWIVTAELAENRPACVRSALRSTVLLGVGLGAAMGAVQFAFAKPMSAWWLGDERAAVCLQILAPSLPFMAAAAALRGYFLARRKAAPNASAQLFEQTLRIGLVLWLLQTALEQGVLASCIALVIGNTVSEIASCIWMVIAAKCDLPSVEQQTAPKPASRVLHRLKGVLLPIAGGRISAEALRTVENVMVPACLAAALGSRSLALEQYGGLKAMAMPVLFFPFSLLGTLATLLTPEITEAYLRNNRLQLRRLVERVVSITASIGILLGAVFTMLAYPLGELLYQSEEIGFYLRILGPLMPLMYLESMVDGILKGMNEQMATFRYGLIDSVVRIVLIAFLVPQSGMRGFLAVMVFSNLFTGLLNFRRLLTAAEIRLHLWRWIAAPTIGAVLCCVGAEKGVSLLFADASLLWQTASCAVLASVCYLPVLALLGGFSIKEWIKK